MDRQNETNSRKLAHNRRLALQRKRSNNAKSATMQRPTDLAQSFQPLTARGIDQIHNAALALLEKTGMANPTAAVQQIAIENGCTLNSNGRLCFPRSLVEDTLTRACKEFVVQGRN